MMAKAGEIPGLRPRLASFRLPAGPARRRGAPRPPIMLASLPARLGPVQVPDATSLRRRESSRQKESKSAGLFRQFHQSARAGPLYGNFLGIVSGKQSGLLIVPWAMSVQKVRIARRAQREGLQFEVCWSGGAAIPAAMGTARPRAHGLGTRPAARNKKAKQKCAGRPQQDRRPGRLLGSLRAAFNCLFSRPLEHAGKRPRQKGGLE